MAISRIVLATLVSCTVLLLGSCGGNGPASEGSGIRVVATTTQIGALTREVANGSVQLTVLLPAGADAHTFEPDPQSVKAIADSDVVLKNGIGLDDWLDDTIAASGAGPRVVTVTTGIAVKKSESEDGDDDPHVWHDPANAKVMVANIAEALAAADPAQASLFRTNSAAYQAKLDDVDRKVAQLIDSIPVSNRKMVTNHDAFGYFIRRYGLTYVGAVFPVNSKEGEVSANELAELEDLIRAEGVKAVFAEAELDPKVATQLAHDAGVEIVTGLYADSLGEPGTAGATVDGMLLFNAEKIAEALK